VGRSPPRVRSQPRIRAAEKPDASGTAARPLYGVQGVIINGDGRRVDELTGEGREGCGFGPCLDSRERGGRGCRLCDVIARLPQPARPAEIVAAVDADAHERAHKNAARDGDPKLPGEKPRRHPMFEKRHRDGPHRSNV